MLSAPSEANPEQVPGLIPLSDDEAEGAGDASASDAQYYENQYMADARQAFDEKQWAREASVTGRYQKCINYCYYINTLNAKNHSAISGRGRAT